MPTAPLNLKTKESVYNLLEKLNHSGYNERGDRIGEIKPTILFFDEIHQMPVIGQEILGLAMERFRLESDRPNQYIWLPYFTVVGATTDEGKLTKPFRDRFKMNFIYQPYSDADMFKICAFHARKKRLPITPKAVRNLVSRSRGVPRMLVNYLDAIRDTMLDLNRDTVTNDIVNSAFESMGIDITGLTRTEVKILTTLYEAKMPIGLDNLVIITNESKNSLMDSIEPFLIRRGFIVRAAKGRSITDKGIKYLEEAGHLSSIKINKVQIASDYRRL
jgi:Holliday junction DNA helicase RuvB